MDDPLSAVDAGVGAKLLDECFCGALAGRTRVLATNALHILQRSDVLIVLGKGGEVTQVEHFVDF